MAQGGRGNHQRQLLICVETWGPIQAGPHVKNSQLIGGKEYGKEDDP